MHEKPSRITLVTPTFNQAPYIAQTLQTVLDQQMGPRLQYIVQDACSTDGTEAIVRRFEPAFRAQGVDWLYVREPDAGQADAINRGWKRATGGVLGFLNSDDYYLPGALAAVLDHFDHHPGSRWAYGGWRLVSSTGRLYRSIRPRAFCLPALLNHCYIGQPACFFRRELIPEIGFLNKDLHLAMDYDFWLRIAALYPADVIPFEIAAMRYYSTAKSAASVRQQAREIYLLGRTYSRPFGWRRLCQRFYYSRALAVILMGRDVSRRIERMESGISRSANT